MYRYIYACSHAYTITNYIDIHDHIHKMNDTDTKQTVAIYQPGSFRSWWQQWLWRTSWIIQPDSSPLDAVLDGTARQWSSSELDLKEKHTSTKFLTPLKIRIWIFICLILVLICFWHCTPIRSASSARDPERREQFTNVCVTVFWYRIDMLWVILRSICTA